MKFEKRLQKWSGKSFVRYLIFELVGYTLVAFILLVGYVIYEIFG